MREILEVGGPGFLVPSVLFVLALYAVRGTFGLHVHKSGVRKDFLELWECSRSDDDLWLEVAIRHWLGTYLPSHVIRLALSQPDRAQSLLELAEIWPFVRYDRSRRTVKWRRQWLRSFERSWLGRWIWMACYFVTGISAFMCGAAAYRMNEVNGLTWVYSALAFALSIFALAALMQDDSRKIVVSSGEEWIARINAASSPALSAQPKSS